MSDSSRHSGSSSAPLLRLRGVSKSFGPVTAVHPIDLDIHHGDFVALLGPSGCGKTTLLRMIGGFMPLTSGRIEIDGADVSALGPEKRPTNMVFQGYGLFPHMNVAQNVAYGLRLKKMARPAIDARVAEALALVQLSDLATRTTEQLSGGQQQRVALARALVMRPKVLLLDEPLAALDLKLRHAMQDELRRIHREIGGTFVFVTHDQGEALALANRIAVMRDGRFEQVGTAEEIYLSPATRFVSTFVGEANLFEGRRSAGTIGLEQGPRIPSAGPEGEVTVVVRPEDLRIVREDEDADFKLPARVTDSIFLGSHVRYRLELAGGKEVFVHARSDGDAKLAAGAAVHVGWSDADQRIVSA